MIKKRIIPCLDIADGKVVKGINFQNIKTIADPVEMATFYSKTGADELVFYDITASYEERGTFVDMVKAVAQSVFIPLTVGGGVRSVADFDLLLKSGADKISINSSAIKNPDLIQEASQRFGSQCVVLSMDVKRVNGIYKVFAKGGREETELEAVAWAQQGVSLGAGELVINSIDTDGVKGGFDIDLLNAISEVVSVPIIASGGAGSMSDFKKLFETTTIDAGLAASIFHTQQVMIQDLKLYLAKNKIPVRFGFIGDQLIPAIVQSAKSKKVLMLAYMNETALQKSMTIGETVFYSRSRQCLWHKGETSGNTQKIVDIQFDCDQDTLLVKVEEAGPACHTGSETCFDRYEDYKDNEDYKDYEADSPLLKRLYDIVMDRKLNPTEGSYTNYLFEKGVDKILKKVGEETAEVIIGAKNTNEELIYETADLFYHVMVLLVNQGVTYESIAEELKKREK